MSSFHVLASRLEILEHTNADALELAKVGGYLSVVRKGEFATGDLALYIPEAAIVPEAILRAMNLWDEEAGKGRLAGKGGTRVKAVRLRGVLSQGLVYVPEGIELEEGEDYAEQLGITKWKPPVPASMDGEIYAVAELRSYTDLENIKKFPGVLRDGEDVIAVEKCHGSCTVLSFIDGELHVSSKGRAASGLALKEAKSNVYHRAVEQYEIKDKLAGLAEKLGAREVTLFGETAGSGVQDLHYGAEPGEVRFYAFDLRVDGEYVDFDEFTEAVSETGLPLLPVLYRGPFSHEAIEAISAGKEQVSGKETHVREGVVVRPAAERFDNELGRVIVKSINPAYLLRKGDATEYE